jgi:hypothetical protein
VLGPIAGGKAIYEQSAQPAMQYAKPRDGPDEQRQANSFPVKTGASQVGLSFPVVPSV